MNLLVRLLLDIKTDFLPLPFALIASLSTSLRHPGTEANTEGVTSGSRSRDRVCSVRIVKAAQSYFSTRTLRGPIKSEYHTSCFNNIVMILSCHWINIEIGHGNIKVS